MVKRLSAEFDSRLTRPDIVAVIRHCCRDLDAVPGRSALPELVERLARQRLNGRTWATVREGRPEPGSVLPVRPSERARDVFDHPYAYAARRSGPATRRVVAA